MPVVPTMGEVEIAFNNGAHRTARAESTILSNSDWWKKEKGCKPRFVGTEQQIKVAKKAFSEHIFNTIMFESNQENRLVFSLGCKHGSGITSALRNDSRLGWGSGRRGWRRSRSRWGFDIFVWGWERGLYVSRFPGGVRA